MKKLIIIGLMIVWLTLIVTAHSDHEHSDFEKAEATINAEIPCDMLNDEELESIGDYYMEQMHPREEHKVMDKIMGGEDSESLKEMHIRMAKVNYCNEFPTTMPMTRGIYNPFHQNQEFNWKVYSIIGILLGITSIVIYKGLKK